MPDLTRDFDSEWLKANLNVNDGDHIRFLDKGTSSPDKEDPLKRNWTFLVGVVRDGMVAVQKKFQLNRSNFKAVSSLYGTNSDKWVMKEMTVNVVKRQNPRTGEMTKGIALSPPGVRGEVEDIDDIPSMDLIG